MHFNTIYIIDDDQQTADLLGEFVELMGYQTNIYTQARKFFEDDRIGAEDFVLILDLNMPEMDGIEVMRRLVEIGYAPPLILVSGYDSGVLHSAEELAKAHSLEIITTLCKPLQFKHLRDAVQAYAKVQAEEQKTPRTNEVQFTVSDLEEAILNKQLTLHYQPQIDIKNGSLVAVEALVRWQHPEHGLIYPNSFIPLIEGSSLMDDLTEQVISQVVEQILCWKSEGVVMQVSVNISAENITSLSLPEQLSSMLSNNKLDPSMLTLEVTETALMGELVSSLDILTRLRMRGVELSIDDFGTGYSSLSRLYRAPFTELKVDLSFVMNMARNKDARGIVNTCIILGHELDMSVVAEGVEDKETLDLLNEMGCDIAQGFYIAKPMTAEDLMRWIKNRNQ